MSSFDAFAKECDVAAKNLRRLPSELRRALAAEVKTEVATPLAAKIGAAASGPWARVLAAGTKARASADPQVVVGGGSPRVSGGAGPRDLVYGTEFGGGGRRTAQRSRSGNLYTRRSTRQFARNKRPFVFDTIRANGEWILDRFAEIVNRVLEKGV